MNASLITSRVSDRAMETVADLRAHATRIESAVNDIIGEMEPNSSLGAVNWADLMCVEVEVSLTNPDLIWTATVEEASPDACKFASLITKELAERGFPHVHVRTEW